MTSHPEFSLRLPGWVDIFLAKNTFSFDSAEDRMQFVIALAEQNILNGGGPFAAAVFTCDSHELIAPGINLVVPLNCSMMHAEMVAISLAQQKMRTFDLGGADIPEMELVTSTEPCAMCMGAVPWSGIHRLVCGARDEDARIVGFDEGAKPEHWEQELKKRGIEIVQDICRAQAAQVLKDYLQTGGLVYNGRQATK